MKLTCSVIMTSHNPLRHEWRDEAIKSVLSQTRPVDYLFLISTYNAFPANAENIVFVPLPNYEEFNNMARKLNIGINMSWTDTFIPMADDDLLEPTFVEKTLGAMEREHDKHIVYTDMNLFGINQRISESPEWDFENIRNGKNAPITSLVRKSVWENSHYKPIDYLDWDFWWSAFENGFSAYHVKEPLFKYRTHPNQWSRTCDVSAAAEVVRNLHAHS